MKRKSMWLAAGLLVLTVTAGAGPAPGPALLLAPGLYVVGDTTGQGAPSAIHADFRRAVGMEPGQTPDAVIARLQQQFDQAFAAEKIEQVTSANKGRTYSVSLELMRADQYRVVRPDGLVDLYLPVSVRIFITSILSGEVLYSRTLTDYSKQRVGQAELDADTGRKVVATAYRDTLNSLIDKVVAETRQQFKPFQVSAKVVDQRFGLYLLDRGIDAGLAAGTELVNALGAGTRVLHAGKTYAVAEPPVLGEIKVGEALTMYASVAAANIVKPRALVLDAEAPADLQGSYAALQFAENLGDRAAFSVVPVNPTFQKVLETISRMEGVQNVEVTQQRVPPDYFVRIRIPEPVEYALPTTKSFSRIRVLEGMAWAELLDQQGRVVYVTQVQERREDEALEGGIAFDAADKRKIFYGNLLYSLSQKFIADVKFRQDQLKVTEVAETTVAVADPQQALTIGQGVRLYRPHDPADGIKETMLLPIWDLTVQERSDQQASLSAELPMAGRGEKIRKGDLVLLQSSGSVGGQMQTASLCPTLQDKSSIVVRDVRELANFALAAGSRLPYFIPMPDIGFMQHAGFRALPAASSVQSSLCYQPLIKIDETARSCNDEKKLCDIELQLVAGVNLLRNGENVGRKVQVVKSQLRNVPQADSAIYLQTQAAQKLFPLLADSVRQADIPVAGAVTQTSTQGK